jgi:hypothetical protein
MNGKEDALLLLRAAQRLEKHVGFVAHDLHRWSVPAGHGGQATLGLDPEALTRLALCRTPRRDKGFAEDVQALARYVHASPAALAAMFREVEAVATLASAPKAALTGAMLAAARDEGDEQTSADLPPAGSPSSPLWLQRCIERFWGEDQPPPAYPRDLELSLLLHQPVALVEVTGLHVADVRAWLSERGVDVLADVADRSLRACLVAYGGVGVVFVDATDSTAERRLSLAHEASHFLLDYLLVRERVAGYEPALLDVLDGAREPTGDEQLEALVANVPLGVHTHLFERGPGGVLHNRSALVTENRAEQVAWELLAPRDEVMQRASSSSRTPTEVLRDDFGLPVEAATTYGTFLDRLAGVPTDGWLDGLK